MALCIVKSCLELGHFDGEDVAHRFVEWARSGPKDIGGTTVRTLRAVDDGTPWYEGRLAEYRRNPRNAANGSLMRNAVIPAFAEDLEEAFRLAIQQSIITHYAPLPVLCCAAQVFLIDRLTVEIAVANEEGWLAEFRDIFMSCIEETDDEGGGRRMRSAMRGVGTALRPTRRAARIHVRVSPSDKKRIEGSSTCPPISEMVLSETESAGTGKPWRD